MKKIYVCNLSMSLFLQEHIQNSRILYVLCCNFLVNIPSDLLPSRHVSEPCKLNIFAPFDISVTNCCANIEMNNVFFSFFSLLSFVIIFSRMMFAIMKSTQTHTADVTYVRVFYMNSTDNSVSMSRFLSNMN